MKCAEIVEMRESHDLKFNILSDMGMGGGGIFGGMVNRLMYRVSGVAFIFNISNVAVDVIGVVGHDLGATIGKSNAIFASNNSIFVL